MASVAEKAQDDPEAPPLKRIKLEDDAIDVSQFLYAEAPAATSAATTISGRRGRKAKRSTEEKAKELLEDTRISAVEPQQVLCRMCGRWIKLFKHTDYSRANWITHADKCEIRTGWRVLVKYEPDEMFALTVGPPPSAPTPAPPEFPLLTIATIESASTRRPSVRTPNERRKLLLQDYRVLEHGPHLVQCGLCKSQVRLHNIREYDLYNWHRHVERCEKKPQDVPPSEVPVTEDVLRLAPEAPITTPIYSPPPLPSGPLPKLILRPTLEHQVKPPLALEQPPVVKSEKTEDVFDTDALYSYTPAIKKKKGRTVEERMKALQKDPRCTDVQAHQVFCLMCKKWIKLYREVEYIDSNWLRHAERCSLRQSNESKSIAGPSARSQNAVASTSHTLAVKSQAPSGSSKNALQREATLHADPRIKTLEAKRIQCKLCDQWIQLHQNRDYDACNWYWHVQLCERKNPDTSCSQRQVGAAKLMMKPVQSISAPAKVRDTRNAEERRQELEADIRCEQVEAHRVFCLLCRTHVGLHAKKDYSTSNWFKHVQCCENKAPGKRKRPDRNTGASLQAPDLKAPVSSGPSDSLPQSQVAAGPETLSGIGLDASASLPAPSDAVHVKQTIPHQDLAQVIPSTGTPVSDELMRKNLEERRNRFLADPRVGAVEPHRVFCKLCNKWYKLSNDIEYATFNWYKHIKRCEGKPTGDSEMKALSATEPVPNAMPSFPLVKQEALPELFTRTPLSLSKRSTAPERMARLQEDWRIKTLEAHRVECGVCGKWIRLQNKTEYDPHNWTTHINKCESKAAAALEALDSHMEIDGSKPQHVVKSRASTGVANHTKLHDRIELLRNDPRCAAMEPNRIMCTFCKQWIKLRDDQQYALSNWQKHIDRCEKAHTARPDAELAPTPSLLPSKITVKEEALEEILQYTTALLKSTKKTEAEREAELRADPRLSAVEPGRVHCKMCDSWIRLNAATGYLSSNWHRHAQRCERKKGPGGKGPAKQKESFIPQASRSEFIDLTAETNSSFGFIELGHLVDAFEPTVSSTDIVIPPPSASANSAGVCSAPLPSASPKMARQDGKRGHRNVAYRKAELEADYRTRIVHPDKILCALCDRWIQMRHDVAYSSQNWLKHANICETRSGLQRREASLSKVNPIPESEPQIPVASPAVDFEIDLPYSARVSSIQEKNNARFRRLDKLPTFNPVDWTAEVIYSDDDDDDSLDENVDVDMHVESVSQALEPSLGLAAENDSMDVDVTLSKTLVMKDGRLEGPPTMTSIDDTPIIMPDLHHTNSSDGASTSSLPILMLAPSHITTQTPNTSILSAASPSSASSGDSSSRPRSSSQSSQPNSPTNTLSLKPNINPNMNGNVNTALYPQSGTNMHSRVLMSPVLVPVSI